MSIALSGFANSAGGILIFGLVAAKERADEPDVISREDPIRNLVHLLPEIQSLIGKAVVPLVDGVKVKAVNYERDPSRGFAFILVPESDKGPHRAMLKGTCKQYYKRSGDSFYMMEHFDLADMFGKRRRPNLRFNWRVGQVSYVNKEPSQFALILGLENIGRGIARFPLFKIGNMKGAKVFEYGLGNRNHGLPMSFDGTPSNVIFAGGGDHVIHPGTNLDITALGQFNVSNIPNVKFTLTLAGEEFEARTQDVVINREEMLDNLKSK